MPKFKDNVTGEIREFAHEPSEQEIQQSFGLPPGAASPSMGGPQHVADENSVAAPGLLGMLGGLIGGKTPAGKIGAGIGAAAGTGYGDLYNMFAHGGASDLIQHPFGPYSSEGVGDAMGDEAKHLGLVGGLTTGAEMVLPPLLRGVGALKSILPKGLGGLAAPALGIATGHTGLGVGAGAAIEAAPKVADAIDWLGTPAGSQAGTQARNAYMQNVPSSYATKPSVMAGADDVERAARAKVGGPMAEVPEYLQQQNWGSSLRNAGNYVKDKASSAIEGLEGFFGGGSGVATPTPPPSPRSPGLSLTKTPGDIAERLGVTGQPASTLPDASRMPDMRWNADVTAAPQRTPQLTQTSPTDPKMAWEEYTSRSAPKRTSTGGQNWGVEEQNVRTNPQTGQSFAGDSAAGPLSGLKSAQPPMSPSSPVHDDGLQRWIEAGGTPETYARAKGALDPNFNQGDAPVGASPYGPNTVGAAQAHRFNTVDEAEGMSLLDQGAFESYKKNNPGADVDQWFQRHGQTEDTNYGLNIDEMADKLAQILKRR